jgi:transketolase
VVGISRFGLSAPAPQAFEALGITTKNLVAVARSF